MGAQQSQLGKQAEEKSGFLQRFLPGQKEFEPLPIPKIIDLDFILENRPNLPQNIQIQRNQNHQQIAAKILEYNKREWNFGNLTGNSQKLMNEVT